MTLQQFVDDKLVEILDRYSVPGQEVGASLKEAVLRSDNKELIIPVLGMQGMGKSTLINAILKEDIMPSEADETTCVPVEVKYGETEQAEVYFSSDTSTKIVHTKMNCMNMWITTPIMATKSRYHESFSIEKKIFWRKD